MSLATSEAAKMKKQTKRDTTSSPGTPSSIKRRTSSRLRSKDNATPETESILKQREDNTSKENNQSPISKEGSKSNQKKRIKASPALKENTEQCRRPAPQELAFKENGKIRDGALSSEASYNPDNNNKGVHVDNRNDLTCSSVTSTTAPYSSSQPASQTAPSINEIFSGELQQIQSLMKEVQSQIHEGFFPNEEEKVKANIEELCNANNGSRDESYLADRSHHGKQEYEVEQERLLNENVKNIQQRFSDAKFQFLQARFQELMLQYLQNPSSYNKETGQWTLPSSQVHMSEEEIRQQQDTLIKRSTQLIQSVTDQQGALSKKAKTLQQSLRVAEEACAELQKLEEVSSKAAIAADISLSENDSDVEHSNVITEEELQEQQRRYEQLLIRKNNAKALLDHAHPKHPDAQATHDDLLRRINSIRLPNASKESADISCSKVEAASDLNEKCALEHEIGFPENGHASHDNDDDNDDYFYDSRLEVKKTYNTHLSFEAKPEEYRDELKAQLENLSEKVEEPTELSEWYEQMNQLTAKLSGTRIIKVENDGQDGCGLQILIELLQRYPLELTLSPRKENPGESTHKNEAMTELDTDEELFFISSARLLEGPHLTIAGDPNSSGVDGDRGKDKKVDKSVTVKAKCPTRHTKPVTLVIPTSLPHDVVESLQGSVMLPQGEDVKYIIQETAMRLLALETRVQDLQDLRSKFLAEIDKKGNEIVCTLNEGITVVLSLNRDCPAMRGSIAIQQIVGMSGWDEKELEEIRREVNKHTRAYGYSSLEIMEELEYVLKQRKCRPPKTPVDLFLLHGKADRTYK